MMTCQHCQTEQYEAVILDDDYRCRRCGRRVRSTPARPGSNRFPVEASATARAYELDYSVESHPAARKEPVIVDARHEQARLFEGTGSDARVIPFDSLTTRAERQSIHARAAGLSRPAPLKTERIQVKHVRPAKVRTNTVDQRRLEFDGQEDMLAPPRPSLICDAPVAPAHLRLEATGIDSLIIAVPCFAALGLFWFAGGSIAENKYSLPLLLMGLATIPLLYKLLWAFAGSDSIGMQCAGLQLVDFDGNPPSQMRRYQRCVGSLLSLLAAGIGLVWSLVDEDRLTWHDHISSTFPTFVEE